MAQQFKIAVEINGIDRMRKELMRLAARNMKAAENEVDQWALQVETGAKRKVAVKTGRLKTSTHGQTQRINAGRFNYRDGEGQTYDGSLPSGSGLGQFEAVAGTNVEYAPKVEYGKVRTRTGEQPFLRPAAIEANAKFIKRMAKRMKDAGR